MPSTPAKAIVVGGCLRRVAGHRAEGERQADADDATEPREAEPDEERTATMRRDEEQAAKEGEQEGFGDASWSADRLGQPEDIQEGGRQDGLARAGSVDDPGQHQADGHDHERGSDAVRTGRGDHVQGPDQHERDRAGDKERPVALGFRGGRVVTSLIRGDRSGARQDGNPQHRPA